MTDNTPTSNQRLLLDVIGTVPSEWEFDVTYPTLPEVTHRFDSLPELVLTTRGGEQSHEIAVQACISDDLVFHGYVVTTTYPEPAVLTAACRERRLTSLSQQELLAEPLSITRHSAVQPTSDEAAAHSYSLSAAASLAGYYAATIDAAVPGDDQTPATVATSDD
ncbi:hypothetical protein NDI56_17730 [Haloarcula sp. S1CR25-12]|uniref:Uncharacterized protein n=1 Tax=Haloarcula saliterrae TaxID=2950534 RepID=A0ABU2FH31_9EURY|nr:hypothetical protein [Haloarcula sp. S1CR25-12]MDS0261243.1 hypothetical protein [Haloarcula sp. S1CR25-12]